MKLYQYIFCLAVWHIWSVWSLENLILFLWVLCEHGCPQGGQKGHLALLEIGNKKQKFLENVKSGIYFWLLGLLLAMSLFADMALTLDKSQVHCFHNMQLWACGSLMSTRLPAEDMLRSSGVNCSTISLCYVTITWQQNNPSMVHFKLRW